MLGSDELDGQQILHYRGSLNLSRTIFENQRRAYAGEAFSESCDGTTCRTLTVEEYYQEEYGDTDFGNVPPSSIDLWVSPQGFLLHSIVIGLPAKKARAEQPDPSDTYFQVDYSRFNEVTIEPPE